jgi:hypothetical protein
MYHTWCIFSRKPLKNPLFLTHFYCLNAKKEAFLSFFEAKYAFFEAVLGGKMVKIDVFGVIYVPEMVLNDL